MKENTKNICLIFQVHQPYRLNEFHFFEIGSHQNYYDEKKNKTILRNIAEESYLPTNQLLLNLIKTYGDRIKVSFAISGTALDQMEQYAPEVLDSFKKLHATGNVELLAQTYSTSLSSLKSKTAFHKEVSLHQKKIKDLFGKKPSTFFNTGLIYSDAIGNMIHNLGFKATIIEGLPTVLKGKNAYAIYNSYAAANLKLLLRNKSFSNDIAFRFSQKDWSEWPLTADTYVNWLKALDTNENVVNLVMDYATFGQHHKQETGIFAFLEYLFRFLALDEAFQLNTPNKTIKAFKAAAQLQVLEPISWAGIEKNCAPWQGNQMQQEALETLYLLEDKIKKTTDKTVLKDWLYLQSADHFYYMNNADQFSASFFNHYQNSYEAFLYYMNVLSDFALRIEKENNTIPEKNLTKIL